MHSLPSGSVQSGGGGRPEPVPTHISVQLPSGELQEQMAHARQPESGDDGRLSAELYKRKRC